MNTKNLERRAFEAGYNASNTFGPYTRSYINKAEVDAHFKQYIEVPQQLELDLEVTQ